MTTEKLNAAIQLIESGHRQAAVPVLREIIQENPAEESAWLWLYTCMDEVEHKKFCLQSALQINPANQQAREALAALNAPAPAPVASAQPEGIRIESREERVENRAEKSEPDEIEQENIKPEKIEQKRIEPEKVEREKMEWEKAEPMKAQSMKAQPLEVEWDDWDDVEPVNARPLKVKPVKALRQPTRRRKTRSKRRSCFPILAGAVLCLMLFTVCFVFLAQIGVMTALQSLLPLFRPTH